MRLQDVALEIDLGSTICKKIKNIYYPDQKWGDSYKLVAQKFAELKKILKSYYFDDDKIEFLKKLTQYSQEDIRECLENQTDS